MYVRVVAEMPSGRKKRSVLRTQLAAGSDKKTVLLAPGVFGRNVKMVALTPVQRFSFRLARLRAPGSILNIVAVVAGIVSGALTTVVTIGGTWFKDTDVPD